MIAAAGFARVAFTRLTGGIVAHAFRLALCDRREILRAPSSALGRAGFVFAREGVFGDVDPTLIAAGRARAAGARQADRAPRAARGRPRLSTALERLGPSYVKLGQFLATRPDVVGPASSRDLEGCRTRCRRFRARSQSRDRRPPSAAAGTQSSSSFGPPVAAASIAQVHQRERARRRGERAVAVKVLRPGVERRFRADLARHVTSPRGTPKRFSAEARRLRPVEVVDTLGRARSRWRWISGSRRRRSRKWPRIHQGRSRFPRARGRLGPHHARKC